MSLVKLAARGDQIARAVSKIYEAGFKNERNVAAIQKHIRNLRKIDDLRFGWRSRKYGDEVSNYVAKGKENFIKSHLSGMPNSVQELELMRSDSNWRRAQDKVVDMTNVLSKKYLAKAQRPTFI